MSTKAVSLALVAALSLGGALSLSTAAFASNTAPVMQTTASVLVLHDGAGSVILSDGQRYVVPTFISLNSFSETENVKVDWQQVGDARVVTAITHAQ
jgi:hypothetical protein